MRTDHRERVETTAGRMKLANLLPRHHMVPFELVNKVLRKGEVGEIIDTVYRHCGQKDSVIFCDQIMTLGFSEAFKAGISFGKDDMVIPATKWAHRGQDARAGHRVRTAVSGRSDHPGREVQQGRRYLGEVHGSRRRRDDEGDPGGPDRRGNRPRERAELDLDDVCIRCAWFAGTDAPAGCDARPDGQTFGRNHRDADRPRISRKA